MKKLAVLAVLLLAGCVSSKASDWHKKDGGTREEFARDSYVCDQDVRVGSVYGVVTAQSVHDKCLNAHGWFKD